MVDPERTHNVIIGPPQWRKEEMKMAIRVGGKDVWVIYRNGKLEFEPRKKKC